MEDRKGASAGTAMLRSPEKGGQDVTEGFCGFIGKGNKTTVGEFAAGGVVLLMTLSWFCEIVEETSSLHREGIFCPEMQPPG